MRIFLYIAVFFSGMASLALEFSASRLLGNYFGSSNMVWASIIGLILIYLTAGYFIGGTWADRSPKYETLYKILAWAALAIGLVPVVSRPILKLAANAFDELQLGVLVGSFVVVMILFIIPVTLLGTASPFAIRLAISDTQNAGKISGQIYAISTLGSFVGTFLPVLVLIPAIGTYKTFVAIGILLMVIALIGLGLSRGWKSLILYSWMPVILILLAIFGNRSSDKASAGMIYEKDSAYNYIQVLEQDGYRLLRLNDGQGIHSIYKPGVYNYNGPWERVLVAPFFNSSPVSTDNIEQIAIVGLAAGTTAKQAAQVFPGVQIDGYEIDPEIVRVGREYFDMNEENLNVIIQDGRWGLNSSGKKYDVISVDAYRPPYIPWHMTTVEFFQIVYDHLTPNGVLVINIGRAPDDRRLVNSLYATISQVFPTLYISDLSGSFNTILYATASTTDLQNLRENYLALTRETGTPEYLLRVISDTYDGLQPAPESALVFSDDFAPVEKITNSMIYKFLISGQVETLQ